MPPGPWQKTGKTGVPPMRGEGRFLVDRFGQLKQPPSPSSVQFVVDLITVDLGWGLVLVASNITEQSSSGPMSARSP